jgi:hypothetical protein
MEQVRFVSRSRMSRRHFVSAYDAQSRGLEGFEQLRAGPQTEVLRQVGKDQPPLTARLQMLRQRREKSAQHAAFGIEDSAFHGRAWPRGNPWRVADNERCATFWKKVRLYDIDVFRKPEPVNVLPRTRQGAWIEIGSDHAFDTAPCKYRGEHTAARADIERNAG